VVTSTVSQQALVYNRISGNQQKIVLLIVLAVASFLPFVFGVSIGFANGYVYQFGNHPSHRTITKEVIKDGVRGKAEIEREIQRRIDIAEAEYKASNDSLRLLVMITVAVALSIVVLLLFWIVTRSSTAKLLETAGARPGGSAASEERVRRTLAKLAERAGIPEPQVYIIDTPVPNSFAMGMRPAESSVVVTEGLMKLLDDRELEGVLAHEISHIGNHDTQLNTVVASVALFLRLPYLIRRRSIERKRLADQYSMNKIGGNKLRIALSPLYLYLYIVAPVLAGFIRAAIARKREYLADVDAVVLTRDAEGLMRALAKIGGAGSSERRANPLLSHAFFADPMPRTNQWEQMQARITGTHPAIQQRIDKLIEVNGESPVSVIEGAFQEGKDFGRDHPPLELLDPATTISQDELATFTVGSPTGRVFMIQAPAPVYESASKSSHVLARIPAGGFLVVFDDPGPFRSVLTQDEVFGYIPATAKMQKLEMMPAEIHDPAARKRAEERLAAMGSQRSDDSALTPTHIAIAAGFTVVMIAGILLVMLQFGGK
jgi:heat shock protein HtpX